MSEHLATTADDLWEGEMLGVELEGVPVLLVNVGGEIRAYRDRCPHQGVRLSEGRLHGATLTCAAHHWTYDVRGGCGINPCTAALEPFAVRVDDGHVWVAIPEVPREP
jgi:toluene monooxygenase system ferredoxin subunit